MYIAAGCTHVESRFRRHGLKKVKSVECTELAAVSVMEQYKRRAHDVCHISVSVLDLGQFAGRTSGACFWLCLAAGLAQCDADVLAQAMPDGHKAQALLAKLRGKAVAVWVAEGVQRSPLGLCGEALRLHFCEGPKAVLLRSDMKAKIYNAFAGLDVKGGPARTELLYQRWVQRLATREFADELVVLAVALELQIRIVIVPYTPTSANDPWAVTTYGPSETTGGQRTIYLGNNDVHYEYLAPDA